MRDVLNWMRVYDSPAADLIAEYFGTLGKLIADDLTQALSKENCWIRHRIWTKTIGSSLFSVAGICRPEGRQPPAAPTARHLRLGKYAESHTPIGSND